MNWNRLACTAVAVAALITPMAAHASQATFNDPAGDATTAPDITSVAISDAKGAVTVTVTASALTPGQTIDIFFDTDKNPATGTPSGGSEFDVQVWQDSGDWGWDMASWNGTTWQDTPQSTEEAFSRAGNVFIWTFPTAEINNTRGFSFRVVGSAVDVNGALTGLDAAPDGGRWVYDLATAAPSFTLALGRPLVVPAAPRAGGLLSLSFPVTRSDAAPVSGATVSATATLGGVAIPRTVAFSAGTVQLAVSVPRKAKGKTLVVKVRVTVAGKTVTRTFSSRVG